MIIPKDLSTLASIYVSINTRPEVSEADPGNQKVTKSKFSKLRPAHRNSSQYLSSAMQS